MVVLYKLLKVTEFIYIIYFFFLPGFFSTSYFYCCLLFFLNFFLQIYVTVKNVNSLLLTIFPTQSYACNDNRFELDICESDEGVINDKRNSLLGISM